MKHRKFGTTDLSLSELGMGTIQITRLPWKESLDVVRKVYDLGVNWFDTARGYFDSELRLGEAMKGWREKIVLSTKSPATDPAVLHREIDECLSRLQTDYIDIFYFHGAEAIKPEIDPGRTEEVLAVGRRAKESGKIRYLGFSTHSVDMTLKALDVEGCAALMIPANFISREYIDGEVRQKAREKGVGLVAMKPFGGGRMNNAALCLKFLKQYEELFPCIGIEKPEEMSENIAVWDGPAGLTENERREIENIRELLGDKFCRGCGYCLPCPQGIEINTITFLNIFAKQMPREKVVTAEHNRAVEVAENCTDCRECVERCPYDLEIPEMIRQNIDFYRKFSTS